MEDLQSGWLLLLMCGAPRSNFWLRTVRRELTRFFAKHNDASVWHCMVQLLSVDPLGEAAHWASWTNYTRTVKQRDPPIAATMRRIFNNDPAPCFREVKRCQRSLVEAGLELPEWEGLAAAPLPRLDGETEPSQPKRRVASKGYETC